MAQKITATLTVNGQRFLAAQSQMKRAAEFTARARCSWVERHSIPAHTVRPGNLSPTLIFLCRGS